MSTRQAVTDVPGRGKSKKVFVIVSQRPLSIPSILSGPLQGQNYFRDDMMLLVFLTLTLSQLQRVCRFIDTESHFVLCLIFKKHHFLRFDLVSKKDMHNYLKKLFKHFSLFQLLIPSLCEARLSSHTSAKTTYHN